MKIIDPAAPIRKQPARTARLLGWLGVKPAPIELSAADILTSNLEKLLDDQYVLMKNIPFENSRALVPALLAGPAGLWLIYPDAAEGVFRAEGSRWEQLQRRGQKYLPMKQNPFLLASSMAAAVEKFLREHHQDGPKIEPVIFFSNPGLHIDAVHPAVRIVMPDTLGRFVAGFSQSDMLLDRENIRNITRILTEQDKGAGEIVIEEIQDKYSLQDAQPESPPRRTLFSNLPKDEPAITRKVPFTRSQWIVLVLLVFVNIIVITALVMLVLINN